uniref:Uncharacterized protein n=1 Tax=Arundo donax TaxID=35708 RepID=A0A0A9EGR2_ARUDO
MMLYKFQNTVTDHNNHMQKV